MHTDARTNAHTHTHLFLSPLPQRYNVLVQLEGLSTACLTSEAVVEVLGPTTRERGGGVETQCTQTVMLLHGVALHID